MKPPYKVKSHLQKSQHIDLPITNYNLERGGKELKKILDTNPVFIEECSLKKAKAGDIEQQGCIAQAYLSEKNCGKAKVWAEKAFSKDSKNDYSQSALDLVEILYHSNECADDYKPEAGVGVRDSAWWTGMLDKLQAQYQASEEAHKQAHTWAEEF